MPDPEHFADDLVFDIQHRIAGRVACEQHNCNYLAWAIALAGNGDHLEIGSLFGGSAILAARIKQRFGHSGQVVCIDPLDGYYIGTPYASAVDPVSKWPISYDVFLANLHEFGVEDRVRVLPTKSQPWPSELIGKMFTSAYIDGNHWGDGPMRDWENARCCVNGLVVFDNHDDKHPAVVAAGRQAKTDPDWEPVLEKGITLIVRKVLA